MCQQLVRKMGLGPNLPSAAIPDLGAAGDGDMDRNMILGKRFFVTPVSYVCVKICNTS